MNTRRLFVISIVLLIIVAGAVGLFKYFVSFSTISIDFSSNAQNINVSVYQTSGGFDDADTLIDSSEPVASNISSSQDIRLKNGNYLVVADGDDYSRQLETVTLDGDKVNVTINPDLSEARLNQLLQSESVVLKQLILKTFPSASKFEISKGQLYNNGEWYATVFRDPKQSGAYKDIFRVVLHKEGAGNWRVVTSPPQLIVSSPSYPEIPADILVQVNKLDFF